MPSSPGSFHDRFHDHSVAYRDRSRREASRARDAGLRRLRSLTRWIAAGAIAVTGVISGIAAAARPGRTAKPPPAAALPNDPAPAVAPPPDPATEGGDPGAADDQESEGSDLQPPSEPPQPSDSPAPSVSGGS